jgi:hypothetical protein
MDFTSPGDPNGRDQDLAIDDLVVPPDRHDRFIRSLQGHNHPWNTETMQEESTLIGSIYVFWAEQNRLWRIEIEEGFSLEDLLVELGTLEEKAIGRKVHGR